MRRSAFALAFLAPLVAHADGPDTARAQALFNVGVQAYGQGEFKGAIDAFEEAYRVSHRPGLLFSIAQARRKQFYAMHDPGDLRASIEHYRAYVTEVPSGKYRVIAVDELAELENVANKNGIALGPNTGQGAEQPRDKPRTRIMVSASVENARVSLDDGPTVPSPLIADVKPGPHSVRVEADGYFPDRHPLTAVDGGLVALEVPMRERPAQLVVNAESGAEVLVDRKLVGRTPLATPIELPAGPHYVALTRNGRRPYGEEIRLVHGETRTLTAEMVGTQQRVLSYALFGTAGVAAIAGAVFVGLAFFEQGQAESILATGAKRNLTQPELDSYGAASNAREGFKIASYCAFGGAAAFALAGAAFFLLDTPHPLLGPARFDEQRDRSKPNGTLEVAGAPIVGPGLVGASVVGRF